MNYVGREKRFYKYYIFSLTDKLLKELIIEIFRFLEEVDTIERVTIEFSNSDGRLTSWDGKYTGGNSGTFDKVPKMNLNMDNITFLELNTSLPELVENLTESRFPPYVLHTGKDGISIIRDKKGEEIGEVNHLKAVIMELKRLMEIINSLFRQIIGQSIEI